MPEESLVNIEFMPPELIKDSIMEQKPWSHDIWSLGIILLEISTGMPVFENSTSRIVGHNYKSALSIGVLSGKPKFRSTNADIEIMRPSKVQVSCCKSDILI